MRESLSVYTQMLIGILYSPAVLFFLLPFITLRFLIKFIHWTHRRSRGGPDMEHLADDISEAGMGLGNRMYYGRRYGAMRRSGMSDGDMGRERRGGRHRW